jgi:hypothetical protein
MGFVRHELGKTLRIKRIPALHIHLDDSAERGTRVLHLLSELESGVDPLEVTPFNESLPTPVKRLPHEGDAEDPAAADAVGDGTTNPLLPAIPAMPAAKVRSSRRQKGRGQGVDRVPRGAASPRGTGRRPGPRHG